MATMRTLLHKAHTGNYQDRKPQTTKKEPMAQKRPHPEPTLQIPELFHSTKIHEQTSSFIGCFSPTLSAPALQRLPEFRTATHRIAAWRKPSKQKSLIPSTPLFDTAHDDDGESWAGGRLARVLNDTQVSGTVVVARWYGGQNIGPVRFTHIENCAKEAIWKWKVAVSEVEREEGAKKQRVDDEASKKVLIEELKQRDHSIVALRTLLAEKKAKLGSEDAVVSTAQRGVEYAKMGLDVLRRMDKARDATIAAILRQIDKVDEELKLLDGIDDDALDELDAAVQPSENDTKGANEEVKEPALTSNDVPDGIESTNTPEDVQPSPPKG
ncbi:hypothetical protein N0V94_007455 [Neodidymelliopsis sp. IMI 364377]|nr:hypothetical protein N0V94_007455 [Neodidymelliopsis sp. IMI 364377]